MKRFAVVAVLLICCAFLGGAAKQTQAGAVDDWLASHTISGPGHYEGSQRNYYYGGTISIKNRTASDNLFTVSPPKIKAGCGGINIFTGGLGFLDFDRLVQKLQNILAAAPAAAFEIALQTLCEPCKNIIAELESISDALNGMQLDECKASKALVAKLASPFSPKDKQAELDTYVSDFYESTGIQSGWERIQSGWNSIKNSFDANAQPTQWTQGCSQEVKEVFGQSGTVLQRMSSKMNWNPNMEDTIRGLVGDIVIEINDSTPQKTVRYVPPCPENAQVSAEEVLNGNLHVRTLFGNNTEGPCTMATDINKNILNYVRTQIYSIKTKMEGGGSPLNATETAFLASVPLPVAQMIKQSITAKVSSDEEMTQIIARAYVQRMLDNFISMGAAAFSAAWKLKGEAIAVPSEDEATCIVDTSGLEAMFADMPRQVHQLRMRVATDYANVLQQMQAFMSLAQSTQKVDTDVRASLSQAFPGLGSRAYK